MVVIGQSLKPRRRSPVFRALVFLLLFALLLLGLVNLGVLLWRMLDRPAAPPTGTLLYAADFDPSDPSLNSYWTTERGQSTSNIDNGVLNVTIGDASDLYSALRGEYGDFDLRVSTRFVAPEVTDLELGNQNSVAVLFRYKDTDNFYSFWLRDDGAYSVQALKSGTSEMISLWHRTDTARTGIGAVNTLRVNAVGDTFTFFINEIQLPLCLRGNDRKSLWNGERCASNNQQISQAWIDSAIPRGSFAFGVDAVTPGASADFDDVVVYAP